jgi:peptide/nickel transport system ATP-binding protein
MTSEASPTLEVQDVVKHFPLPGASRLGRTLRRIDAVSGVSFAIHAAETFGLVGESGSGKTTLARMVLALETPTAGEVRVHGLVLGSLSRRPLREARRLVQPVFQDAFTSLDPRMRVGPIIAEPLAAQHVDTRKQRRAHVIDLLNEVGLAPDVAHRHPHELSGGQRQRVALARALALRPQLIVADEPVSALDVSIRAQILNLMNELRRSHRLTYLFISHDLSVVRYIADRIGVMYLGKLVELGPSASVYSRPAHPYTAGLVRAVPTTDASSTQRRATRSAPVGEMASPTDPPSGCRYRTRCPIAAERCTTTEPTLRSVRSGHLVACHFPLDAPR